MTKAFKRLLCAVLVLALLAGGAYALSAGDSLVTLSYLTGTFQAKALEQGETAANNRLQQAYDDGKAALDEVQADLLGQSSAKDILLYSASLAPQDLSEGNVLTVNAGSGFLLLEGTALVTHSGAVIDVSLGQEVSSGTYLTAYHRYLVGEDTSATVSVLSGAAQLGVEGVYAAELGQTAATPFYDVARNDWFYSPVSYVYTNGLFSGMSEHSFSPNAAMNRAMLMTVLYRLAGAPQEEMDGAQAGFSDVSDASWYAGYVKWGASQGITAGTSATTFSPERQITREQLVVLLYSFATNYLGMTLSTRADLSGYEDLSQASAWAKDALAWAVGQGIITSSSTDKLTLSPQKSANRAEVATMLRAFSEKVL
jgi:hypothetical protein